MLNPKRNLTRVKNAHSRCIINHRRKVDRTTSAKPMTGPLLEKGRL